MDFGFVLIVVGMAFGCLDLGTIKVWGPSLVLVSGGMGVGVKWILVFSWPTADFSSFLYVRQNCQQMKIQQKLPNNTPSHELQ